MLLRELELEDLPALLDLYQFLHPSDAPLPDAATVDSIWGRINADSSIKYYGIFVDERLIASCNIALIPNLTRACRSYGVIENVVTHEAYRNKGYGKTLLKTALEHAWQQGCYKVVLTTSRLNEHTFEFYKSAGFDGDTKRAFLARPPEA